MQEQQLSQEQVHNARGPVEGEVVPSLGTDVKRTLRLFWPIFLGQLSSSAMGVVDTVMAGAAGTIDLSVVQESLKRSPPRCTWPQWCA